MKIRKLNLDELSIILDLIEEFDREPAERPDLSLMKQILDRISSNGGAILGAELNGVIVGTSTLAICPNLSWSGRSYAIIENVVVSKAFRRRGIGKALMLKAQSLAKEADCYKVALMTGSQRTSTFKFYEACGFIGNKTGFQLRFNA